MAEDTQIQAFLLKILAGDHQGAEVALEKESLWIGQSDDCDIVLSDSLLLPKHLKIEIQQNVYSLIPQKDAKTYVNGQLLTQPFSPPPFQYISIGSTLIAIGPENETWPNLPPNLAPPLEAEVIQQSPQPPTTVPTDTPNAPTQTLGNELPLPNPSLETTEIAGSSHQEMQNAHPEPTESTNTTPRVKKLFTVERTLIFGSVFCIIIGILFTSVHVIKRPKQTPKIELIPAIQKILTELKVQDNVQINQDTPVPSVTGWVKTKAEKSLLMQALQALAAARSITGKFWSEEKLALDLKEFIRSLHAPLTITPTSPLGSFAIAGYLADADQVATFAQRVKEEIPGIRQLSLHLLTADEVSESTNAVLQKHHLNALITATTLSTGLLLQGSIDRQLSQEWESAQEDLRTLFKEKFPLILRINIASKATLKAHRKNFFDSEVESITISTDGVSCIDLRNGNRYFERSVLPSGYVISKISPSTIILSKGNEEMELPLSELK